jgi:hypothetical protein
MPGSNSLSSIQHIVVLMLENRSFEPTTPNACFMPGADPGEGYLATDDQLFGSESAPASSSLAPSNDGFVKGFTYTYDEHGGCYDHVAPPSGAIPPDHDAGEFGFTRFGLRVPAVLVSPLIAPGTDDVLASCIRANA